MSFFWGTSNTCILIQWQFSLYKYLTQLYRNKATALPADLIKLKIKKIFQSILIILKSIH